MCVCVSVRGQSMYLTCSSDYSTFSALVAQLLHAPPPMTATWHKDKLNSVCADGLAHTYTFTS